MSQKSKKKMLHYLGTRGQLYKTSLAAKLTSSLGPQLDYISKHTVIFVDKM